MKAIINNKEFAVVKYRETVEYFKNSSDKDQRIYTLNIDFDAALSNIPELDITIQNGVSSVIIKEDDGTVVLDTSQYTAPKIVSSVYDPTVEMYVNRMIIKDNTRSTI